MKAGRELDALVAEKMMGWKYIPDKQERKSWISTLWVNWKDSKGTTQLLVPSYSTSIAAAWLVEERIKELGLEPEYSEALLDLTDASEHFELIHASPEDRCLAALKAVECML